MSCNAHNHRPGCDCGWGGVFYGLGLGTSKSYWHKAESYTVPNARCPRCAALVYFYRSPHGGSVYFDDLGPPWPKHPCTDSGEQFISSGRPISRPIAPVWFTDGWHPMHCQSIGKLQGEGEITVLLVGEGDAGKQLFAQSPSAMISFDSPMLWRRKGDEKGCYEISTLDLSGNIFREIRIDVYSELKQLKKAIQLEKLWAEIFAFDQRMANVKSDYLKVLPKKDFGEKIDTLIKSHREALLGLGDKKEIEKAALLALKRCFDRELLIQEKARNSLELHAALLDEGIKIVKDFSNSGVDLKRTLQQERKRAISAGLSIEAAKASLRAAAESALRAKLLSDQRALAKNQLDSYIVELLASSELLGDRARFILENAIQRALQKDPYSVDLIKEELLGLTRLFLEDAAKQLASKQERIREAYENELVLVHKNRIKSAVRHHPEVSEKTLIEAVEQMTNRNSSIEEIQLAAGEVAKKLILKNQKTTVKSPNLKPQLKKTVAPFNSAMADKLEFALKIKLNGK